jgi:hypothetical protein
MQLNLTRSLPSLGGFVLLLLVLHPEDALGQIRFNESIRPILSDKCFFCHGPDAANRQADLRLDVRDDAIAHGAITPGNLDKSEILSRIHSDDPDLQMPPPTSKLPKLTKEEIGILEQWIREGAPYQKHWAFESLDWERLAPYLRKNSDQVDLAQDVPTANSPIDSFVKKELSTRGLSLQPSADRQTLARRAALDITGLPPDPALLHEYLNATDELAAYGVYLDKLLASPHFGEKMAVDWLDIARYSDSFGFQVDRERAMWQWRDWVIRSFNENKPFDQFIVEQIAGDMLANPTKDQILATAFNRLHQQESEGGSVEEEYRVEYVADRLQTYATAFLGLTFECARCHDHKFDPISQKEYYGLFAMFQNIDEAGLYSFFTDSPPTPAMSLSSEDQDKTLSELKEQSQKAFHDLIAHEATLSQIPENFAIDTVLQLVATSRTPIAKFDFDSLEDRKLKNSVAADKPATVDGENKLAEGRTGMAMEFTGDDAVKTPLGNFQREEPFSVSLWLKTPDVKERAVVFHRSRAWTDAASRGYELLIEDGKLKWSLIHFWPGNAISIKTTADVPLNQWTHVAVTYDGSSQASGLQIFVNGKLAAISIEKDKLTKTIAGGGYDNIDLGERFRDKGFKNGLIDDFQVFSFALTPWEVLQQVDPESAKATLQRAATDHDAFKQWVAPILAQSNEQSTKLSAELKIARKKWYDYQDSFSEIMVMQELATPKPAFVLVRGEYNQPAEPVSAMTPQVLPPLAEGLPNNRLGLAHWTVGREHPLTARVSVNRIWQSIFGIGLVKTSEDFGSQGSLPLYQNVLDALSASFIDSGWNTKELMKTILMSETYRQRSVSDNPQLMADDPENEILSRGPRIRLSAEMIRDNMLASAGLIDLSIGGPPVNPYELSESFKPAGPSGGNGVYRRSLYTNWRRTGPPPAMIAFDAPRRAVCTPKRERTESALQSLILLNGVQYVEAARALAAKAYSLNPSDEVKQIETIFQACINRAPQNREVEICQKLLNEQRELFKTSPEKAKEFLSVGRYKVDVAPPDEVFAALTVLSQTLFNHDSCIMKR